MKVEQKKEFGELQDALQFTLERAGHYAARMERQADARYCWWEGQSADGRKHSEYLGREAFPWDEATDSRYRLAEEVIRADVDIQMAAWERARFDATPTEANDMEASGVARTLLTYLMRNKLRAEVKRELRLALNWGRTYALSFLYVCWRPERKLRHDETNVESLEQMVEMGMMDESTLEAFMDAERESEAAEFLEGLLDVDGRTAQKIVRDVRTSGRAEFERPVEGGWPKVRAMKPWVDVFFPTDTVTIQDAPMMWIRETYTEDELQARALAEDWTAAFVKAVLKKGAVGKGDAGQWRKSRRKRASLTQKERSSPFLLFGDESSRYEVFRCYRKKLEPRSGAVRLEYLVMSRDVKDEVGLWELHPYEHALYPVVELVPDRVEARLVEARSVPEMLETHQSHLKRTVDFRGDRGDITILPPLRTPSRGSSRRMDIAMGPAAQLPDRTGAQYGWLQPPQYDPSSREFESALRSQVDRLYSREAEGVSPTQVRAYVENLVNEVMEVGTSMLEQVFALAQQYMGEMRITRVVGTQRVPLAVSGEDIRGRYDLSVEVSADELDLNLYVKKLEVISRMLIPLDTGATVDRGELVAMFMRGLDPQLAERVVEDKGTVRQREIDDEKQQFALMVAGVPPTMQMGLNFELRRDTLMELMQGNPAHGERFAQDEVFRNLVENRLKFFNQQIVQQNNVVIGEFGVDPARQMEAQ